MSNARKLFRNRSGWFWFGFALLVGLFLFVSLVGYVFYINQPVKVNLPLRNVPANNSLPDVEVILSRMATIKPTSPLDGIRPLSGFTMDELSKFHAANASDIEDLAEAIEGRPFVHRRRYDPKYVQNMDTNMREGVKRIVGDSYYHTQIGQYGNAADRMILGYELSVRYTKGGTAKELLEANFYSNVSTEFFHDILEQLNASQLAELQSDLSRIESLHTPIATILDEDRYLVRYDFAQLWQGDGLWANISNIKENDRKLKFLVEHKKKTLRVIDHRYDEFIVQTAGAYRLLDLPDSTYFALYDIGNGLADYLFRTYCLDKSRLKMMQAEVALRRFWLKNGRYPADLKDLTPGYLPGIPTDPFNENKPLTYRQLDGGKDFLLYSYGANAKDDHGKPGNYKGPNAAADMVAGKWSKQ